eukprot:jgi/Mesvir1/27947/Mv20158-RA.3
MPPSQKELCQLRLQLRDVLCHFEDKDLTKQAAEQGRSLAQCLPASQLPAAVRECVAGLASASPRGRRERLRLLGYLARYHGFSSLRVVCATLPDTASVCSEELVALVATMTKVAVSAVMAAGTSHRETDAPQPSWIFKNMLAPLLKSVGGSGNAQVQRAGCRCAAAVLEHCPPHREIGAATARLFMDRFLKLMVGGSLSPSRTWEFFLPLECTIELLGFQALEPHTVEAIVAHCLVGMDGVMWQSREHAASTLLLLMKAAVLTSVLEPPSVTDASTQPDAVAFCIRDSGDVLEGLVVTAGGEGAQIPAGFPSAMASTDTLKALLGDVEAALTTARYDKVQTVRALAQEGLDLAARLRPRPRAPERSTLDSEDAWSGHTTPRAALLGDDTQDTHVDEHSHAPVDEHNHARMVNKHARIYQNHVPVSAHNLGHASIHDSHEDGHPLPHVSPAATRHEGHSTDHGTGSETELDPGHATRVTIGLGSGHEMGHGFPSPLQASAQASPPRAHSVGRLRSHSPAAGSVRRRSSMPAYGTTSAHREPPAESFLQESALREGDGRAPRALSQVWAVRVPRTPVADGAKGAGTGGSMATGTGGEHLDAATMAVHHERMGAGTGAQQPSVREVLRLLHAAGEVRRLSHGPNHAGGNLASSSLMVNGWAGVVFGEDDATLMSPVGQGPQYDVSRGDLAAAEPATSRGVVSGDRPILASGAIVSRGTLVSTGDAVAAKPGHDPASHPSGGPLQPGHGAASPSLDTAVQHTGGEAIATRHLEPRRPTPERGRARRRPLSAGAMSRRHEGHGGPSAAAREAEGEVERHAEREAEKRAEGTAGLLFHGGGRGARLSTKERDQPPWRRGGAKARPHLGDPEHDDHVLPPAQGKEERRRRTWQQGGEGGHVHLTVALAKGHDAHGQGGLAGMPVVQPTGAVSGGQVSTNNADIRLVGAAASTGRVSANKGAGNRKRASGRGASSAAVAASESNGRGIRPPSNRQGGEGAQGHKGAPQGGDVEATHADGGRRVSLHDLWLQRGHRKRARDAEPGDFGIELIYVCGDPGKRQGARSGTEVTATAGSAGGIEDREAPQGQAAVQREGQLPPGHRTGQVHADTSSIGQSAPTAQPGIHDTGAARADMHHGNNIGGGRQRENDFDRSQAVPVQMAPPPPYPGAAMGGDSHAARAGEEGSPVSGQRHGGTATRLAGRGTRSPKPGHRTTSPRTGWHVGVKVGKGKMRAVSHTAGAAGRQRDRDRDRDRDRESPGWMGGQGVSADDEADGMEGVEGAAAARSPYDSLNHHVDSGPHSIRRGILFVNRGRDVLAGEGEGEEAWLESGSEGGGAELADGDRGVDGRDVSWEAQAASGGSYRVAWDTAAPTAGGSAQQVHRPAGHRSSGSGKVPRGALPVQLQRIVRRHLEKQDRQLQQVKAVFARRRQELQAEFLAAVHEVQQATAAAIADELLRHDQGGTEISPQESLRHKVGRTASPQQRPRHGQGEATTPQGEPAATFPQELRRRGEAVTHFPPEEEEAGTRSSQVEPAAMSSQAAASPHEQEAKLSRHELAVVSVQGQVAVAPQNNRAAPFMQAAASSPTRSPREHRRGAARSPHMAKGAASTAANVATSTSARVATSTAANVATSAAANAASARGKSMGASGPGVVASVTPSTAAKETSPGQVRQTPAPQLAGHVDLPLEERLPLAAGVAGADRSPRSPLQTPAAPLRAGHAIGGASLSHDEPPPAPSRGANGEGAPPSAMRQEPRFRGASRGESMDSYEGGPPGGSREYRTEGQPLGATASSSASALVEPKHASALAPPRDRASALDALQSTAAWGPFQRAPASPGHQDMDARVAAQRGASTPGQPQTGQQSYEEPLLVDAPSLRLLRVTARPSPAQGGIVPAVSGGGDVALVSNPGIMDLGFARAAPSLALDGVASARGVAAVSGAGAVVTDASCSTTRNIHGSARDGTGTRSPVHAAGVVAEDEDEDDSIPRPVAGSELPPAASTSTSTGGSSSTRSSTSTTSTSTSAIMSPVTGASANASISTSVRRGGSSPRDGSPARPPHMPGITSLREGVPPYLPSSSIGAESPFDSGLKGGIVGAESPPESKLAEMLAAVDRALKGSELRAAAAAAAASDVIHGASCDGAADHAADDHATADDDIVAAPDYNAAVSPAFLSHRPFDAATSPPFVSSPVSLAAATVAAASSSPAFSTSVSASDHAATSMGWGGTKEAEGGPGVVDATMVSSHPHSPANSVETACSPTASATERTNAATPAVYATSLTPAESSRKTPLQPLPFSPAASASPAPTSKPSALSKVPALSSPALSQDRAVVGASFSSPAVTVSSFLSRPAWAGATLGTLSRTTPPSGEVADVLGMTSSRTPATDSSARALSTTVEAAEREATPGTGIATVTRTALAGRSSTGGMASASGSGKLSLTGETRMRSSMRASAEAGFTQDSQEGTPVVPRRHSFGPSSFKLPPPPVLPPPPELSAASASLQPYASLAAPTSIQGRSDGAIALQGSRWTSASPGPSFLGVESLAGDLQLSSQPHRQLLPSPPAFMKEAYAILEENQQGVHRVVNGYHLDGSLVPSTKHLDGSGGATRLGLVASSMPQVTTRASLAPSLTSSLPASSPDGPLETTLPEDPSRQGLYRRLPETRPSSSRVPAASAEALPSWRSSFLWQSLPGTAATSRPILSLDERFSTFETREPWHNSQQVGGSYQAPEHAGGDSEHGRRALHSRMSGISDGIMGHVKIAISSGGERASTEPQGSKSHGYHAEEALHLQDHVTTSAHQERHVSSSLSVDTPAVTQVVNKDASQTSASSFSTIMELRDHLLGISNAGSKGRPDQVSPVDKIKEPSVQQGQPPSLSKDRFGVTSLGSRSPAEAAAAARAAALMAASLLEEPLRRPVPKFDVRLDIQ